MTERTLASRILMADIGGTTARFGFLEAGRSGPVAHLAVKDHVLFTDALRAFLATAGTGGGPVAGAVLAVAGPVVEGRCVLTNSRWVVDSAELAADFGLGRVEVVNDFKALARSLPFLGKADLFQFGGGEPLPAAPKVILGPGTGLGVAGLIPRAGGEGAVRDIVIASEGGHATAPGTNPQDDAVIASLRRRFGHVSAERMLSGQGIENIHRAIAEIEGAEAIPRTAAEISAEATAGTCPISRQALDTFMRLLGAFAGDLALIYGARGGVYIGGGIAPRLLDELARSDFRRAFETKGRLGAYLQQVPCYVITKPDVAFLGLTALAAELAAPVLPGGT